MDQLNKKVSQKYGSVWSRDETILALYLYCQIPFAKTKQTNPSVNRLAHLIDRTPSAVARKLGNLGAFDERLAEKGISGLKHHSKQDALIWNEFSQNWEALVDESLSILSKLEEPRSRLPERDSSFDTILKPPSRTEKPTITLARVGQDFFRRTVLASHDFKCCICGLDLAELLIASHIIPWSVRTETRLDPCNGIALCTLHDKSFDRGLLSITPDYTIRIAGKVNSSRSDFVKQAIIEFEGFTIKLPSRFTPNIEFLAWHLENVFLG